MKDAEEPKPSTARRTTAFLHISSGKISVSVTRRSRSRTVWVWMTETLLGQWNLFWWFMLTNKANCTLKAETRRVNPPTSWTTAQPLRPASARWEESRAGGMSMQLQCGCRGFCSHAPPLKILSLLKTFIMSMQRSPVIMMSLRNLQQPPDRSTHAPIWCHFLLVSNS